MMCGLRLIGSTERAPQPLVASTTAISSSGTLQFPESHQSNLFTCAQWCHLMRLFLRAVSVIAPPPAASSVRPRRASTCSVHTRSHDFPSIEVQIFPGVVTAGVQRVVNSHPGCPLSTFLPCPAHYHTALMSFPAPGAPIDGI